MGRYLVARKRNENSDSEDDYDFESIAVSRMLNSFDTDFGLEGREFTGKEVCLLYIIPALTVASVKGDSEPDLVTELTEWLYFCYTHSTWTIDLE